ncbi:MAG: TetR/AcrR family transcriptional regulator [Sphaerochaetaceae bacterium]|nr:TetR/AcrR family transcriptional regulator [Sphaerochaetaceae bacterium]
MPKVIDHKKRKDLIVKTALRVYDEGGLKEANLSRIAQEANLSRTTVYQYFKDVSDVFNYLVKTQTDKILQKYLSEEWSQGSSSERLRRITADIIDTADKYKVEIIRFVKSINAIDANIENIVHHRTAKLRLFLSRLVRGGIREGSIRKCSSTEATEKIMAIMLSYGFMLAYFPESAEFSRTSVTDYVDYLSSSSSKS